MLNLLDGGDAIARGVNVSWVGLVEVTAVGAADCALWGKGPGDQRGGVGLFGGGGGLPVS